MRIIALKTLKNAILRHPDAEGSLLAWYEEVEKAEWLTPNELKEQYRSASILNNKRVIFNIHGNTYRLIADIEYKFKIVYVVWFGTHREYDRIDAKSIKYVKAD